MEIKTFTGGVLKSNGYIIYKKGKKTCYIIDPGYKANKFIDFVQKNDLCCKGILLTHHHYDHVGAAGKTARETDCPVFIHRQDIDKYKNEAVPMEDGEIFLLDEEEIRVIHTPGHTHGGVCYYSEKSKTVFTGDTVFNVDLGRTDLSDGSEKEMQDSIRNIISLGGNYMIIYPGHGDACTMKYVRKNNKEFKETLK